MRLLFLTIYFFCCTTTYSQINFEERYLDSALYAKSLSADSAIQKGEFGEIHSLLVIKNGHIVFENYYNNWHKDSLHQLQSATKSVVATLLGCALQKSFIKSEDEPVSNYFPLYSFSDSLRQQIKIKDLLTQRHGLDWNEGAWDDPNNTWRKVMSEKGDWYKSILEIPMDTLPGTKYNYSNAAPLLISGIIQNASKMNIDSFANEYLFKPVGISNYWFWQGNGGPKNNGMALISLTSRDMAKIGQLYFQLGKWKDIQILSEAFVNTATSGIVKGVGLNGAYKQYDYGYFWWSNPVSQSDKKTDIFLARGAGGQNIIVNRKDKLVVVITAWNMQQPNKPQLIYDWYLAD